MGENGPIKLPDQGHVHARGVKNDQGRVLLSLKEASFYLLLWMI